MVDQTIRTHVFISLARVFSILDPFTVRAERVTLNDRDGGLDPMAYAVACFIAPMPALGSEADFSQLIVGTP